MGIHLDAALVLAGPAIGPEEDLAEGAGVPFALDRDAVRAQQVVGEGPILVGALEPELELEAVHGLPEPERLGDDHAVARRGPEDDLLALERLARARVDGGEGVHDLSRLVSHDFPENGVEQVLGLGDPLGLLGLIDDDVGCPVRGLVPLARQRVGAESQRQGRRPDRIAADELERQVGVVSSLELGVVTRGKHGLDASAFLVELHLQPVAARRLVGGRAQDQALGVNQVDLRRPGLVFLSLAGLVRLFAGLRCRLGQFRVLRRGAGRPPAS